MKEFGKELIRLRRLELNLSFRDLSKKTGISNSTLCKLEKGTADKLKLSNMIILCNALNIDLFKILELDEDFIVISKYFYGIFVGKYISPKIYE